MAVTNLQAGHVGGNSWKLTWEGDDGATFYVYQDGILLGTTAATRWLVTLQSGDAPVFEVLDTADAPQRGYPARVTLAWGSVSGAAAYRVEEYVAAVWTAAQTISAETGRTAYQYLTRALEDVTTHQFRIVPVGADGNDGTPLAFSVLMVRAPEPPGVTYTYNGSVTRTVTIAAA